ncbi:MAG: hypothetical protein QHC78_17950 [Pigmentiphaga sp.]|uniref:hypothetical protein n=1 Tax=Pigmentiphaga sp. TaxID=1977564 RepID=UPI0029B261BD|nr:hypothetical protein [Pigmentiphaga sp.]MDX3907577.1 hypothetical protein [Pigmentiphaga sp.]
MEDTSLAAQALVHASVNRAVLRALIDGLQADDPRLWQIAAALERESTGAAELLPEGLPKEAHALCRQLLDDWAAYARRRAAGARPSD